MSTINSHPGVPLIHHLKAVSINCLEISKKNKTDFNLSQSTKETLAYLCGAFHDLGKATIYFQEYLKNPTDKHSSLKNHALPSAVFVFYVVTQLKELLPDDEKEKVVFLACLCFTVVKRHHGHLNDLHEEINPSSRKEDLQKQYAAIDIEAVQSIIDEVLKNHPFDIKWTDFVNWVNSSDFEENTEYAYLDFNAFKYEAWDKDQKASSYYLFLWLFGTLLYSDKSDVILGGTFPILPNPKIQFLESFRKVNGFDNPSSKINKLKNEAYFSVLDELENNFAPSQRFYSITLPTGLGKTLTSLGAALKLKSLAGLDRGIIIIAIPFTSIIDQNFHVYDEVFNHPDNTFLLKHHHLSEHKYKEEEDTVRNEDQSQHLIETWQSSIVVTTFVQLLEGVITNNKSKLLKFSSISNSVILLDEVQQVPYAIWQLIRKAFFTIAEHLNCYFILMSATQPLIFYPEKEIKELVSTHEKYFSFFNRTQLVNKTQESITMDAFIDDVASYAEEHPDKDILIILNTKKTTLQCFRRLKPFIDSNTEIRYLTTLITPYERRKIISEIKKEKRDKRYIIVSTQLVEAGVDISVDIVFRALAPLDSIIQAAGRANRYNEKFDTSDVYIYKIADLYQTSCRLYGKELMLKTELVIKNKDIIPEADYLKLIKKYFEEIKSLADFSDKSLLNSLLNLEFRKTGEFHLIEEVNSESLYVALNENAKNLWYHYISIQENESFSFLEKKKSFSNIKSRFYEYVINVPIPYGKKDIGLPFEPNYGFYYWEYDDKTKELYSYHPSDTSKNEGYVYEELANLSF